MMTSPQLSYDNCNVVSTTGSTRVLMDTGSTITILTSTAGCVNIRSRDEPVQTGSGFATCKYIADFVGHTSVAGKLVPISIPDVRIVPGFSTQLLSLVMFSRAGCSVDISETDQAER